MSFLLTVIQGNERGDGVEILPGVFLDSSDLRVSNSGEYIAVAGCGRLGDSFVGASAAVDTGQLRRQIGHSVKDAMLSIAGSLALVFRGSDSQTAFVLADPLGGQPVFRIGRDTDNVVLLGSDPVRMVDSAQRFGINLEPSEKHISELTLTGNAGFGGVSYKGLDVLPQFCTVSITQGRINVTKHDRPWKDSSIDPMNLGSDSYWESIEEIANDIRRNIQAVIEYPALSRVSHLTGGFDSRLVLAGLRNLNATENFGFFCSGSPAQEDKRIYLGLASSLDLNPADRSGISASKYPTSLEQDLLWPMLESAGMRTDGPNKYTDSYDTVVLSGGYGELLRAFYSRKDLGVNLQDIPALSRSIWGGAATNPTHPSCFLTQEAIDMHNEAIRGSINLAMEDGVREDYFLDHMYVTIRNRFYVGLGSALYSKYIHRFDPLYSIAAVRLASRLPVDLRMENMVGLDVMNNLAPELLSYDFDTPRVSPRYRELRSVQTRREFDQSRPSGSKTYRVPYRAPVQPPKAYFPPATAAQVETANTMKATLRHVVQIDHVRSQLSTLSEKLRGSDAENYLDFDKLNIAARRRPTNRVVMRSMFSCYSSLLWYANTKGIVNEV